MKRKITFHVIAMTILLVAAFLLYNNAPAVANAISCSVRFVDVSAAGLALAMVFPSSSINAIRREAKTK